MSTDSMDFATLDFETYYDKDFSLSKMQTDAYVLDDRFEIVGVGLKPSRTAGIEWFSGAEEEVKDFLQDRLDWRTATVCCHNTMFDGFILTQRLGLKPKLWMDTLAMSRAAFPWLASHSLSAVAEYLGLGQKGHEVQKVMGMRRDDFSPAALERYAEYCINDVALTSAMAAILLDLTPPLELKLIDWTVRMFTEPTIQLDRAKLVAYYEGEVQRKEKLLASTAADKDTLMSNPKFARALIDLGVIPPMKESKTTGKRTYAFAKSDKALTALLEHPDPDVQALVAARLGVKTTIAETRAQMLLDTEERGIGFPIYLNYWGAKTTGRMCLTGDTAITVLRKGEVLDILLPELLPDDLVWDGEWFVSHGGLIDQGEQEVMTYDGITGTPDHRVFCEEVPEEVELRIAAERNYTLKTARTPAEHKSYIDDCARGCARWEA